MSHKHLNYEQRCMIYALRKAGRNQTQIAKEMGVHRSTISRELNRNLYRFILEDKNTGGDLYLSLRHRHKRYRKCYGSSQRQHTIKDRIMIDDRPSIVDEKQ